MEALDDEAPHDRTGGRDGPDPSTRRRAGVDHGAAGARRRTHLRLGPGHARPRRDPSGDACMFPVLARRWYVQLPVALVAVAVAVVAAVWIDGGRVPADVVDAIARGPRRILSTEWPSPIRPDLTGTVAALLAVTSALATVLASKVRWHLLPLAPPLVTFVVICGLSAAEGSGIVWLLPLAPLAALFAVLRPGGASAERLRILAGERLLLLTAVATGLAAAVSIPVAFADRADPRQIEPAATTAPIIDPIEATIALRQLDPPIVVYDVSATDGSTALPARWRTSTRDTYDGQRWTPTLTLRPIGRPAGTRPAGCRQRRGRVRIRRRLPRAASRTTDPDRCRRPDRFGAHGRPTRRPPHRRPRRAHHRARGTFAGRDRRRDGGDPRRRRDLRRLHRGGEQPRRRRNRGRTARDDRGDDARRVLARSRSARRRHAAGPDPTLPHRDPPRQRRAVRDRVRVARPVARCQRPSRDRLRRLLPTSSTTASSCGRISPGPGRRSRCWVRDGSPSIPCPNRKRRAPRNRWCRRRRRRPPPSSHPSPPRRARTTTTSSRRPTPKRATPVGGRR